MPASWRHEVSDSALLAEVPLGLERPVDRRFDVYTPEGELSSCEDYDRWEAESEGGRYAISVDRSVHYSEVQTDAWCSAYLPIRQTVARVERTVQQATAAGLEERAASSVQVGWSVAVYGAMFVGSTHVDLAFLPRVE